MKVYIKSVYKQQTVRDIPFFKALYMRFCGWFLYRSKDIEERPVIRFLI